MGGVSGFSREIWVSWGRGWLGLADSSRRTFPVGGGAHRQQDLVPAGLIDLINFSAGDRLVQFVDQAGQAEGV